MAFATELVLAAQTGPEVDYRTVSTATRADSGSWGSICSTSVSAGTWLVVVDCKRGTPGVTYGYSTEIRVNGNTQIFAAESGSKLPTGHILRHLSTVTGPASIAVESRYGAVNAGTLHLARIG